MILFMRYRFNDDCKGITVLNQKKKNFSCKQNRINGCNNAHKKKKTKNKRARHLTETEEYVSQLLVFLSNKLPQFHRRNIKYCQLPN